MITKEQIKYYMECADAEMGPECCDEWVEEVREYLRAFPAQHTAADNEAEIDRLRRDCGELYQVIGYALFGTLRHDWTEDDVVRALDNASAAAQGRPRPHDDLLPWPKGKPCTAADDTPSKSRMKRIAALTEGKRWDLIASSVAADILFEFSELAEVEPHQDTANPLGLSHLHWMARELSGRAVGSSTKACRWLGWLQAGLVATDLSDLEREKARNLRAANDAANIWGAQVNETPASLTSERVTHAIACELAKQDSWDDPNELLWDVGTIPEPRGEVWQEYEERAKAIAQAVADQLGGGK